MKKCKSCLKDGDSRTAVCKDLCDKHYRRLKRNGNPDFLKREKHGKNKTTEYIIWNNMKDRCFNVKNEHYNRYGGRGINVCPSWKNSFMSFYSFLEEEIGLRPSKYYTLDRINNDGNYEPGNVRWADKITQSRNRSVREGSKSGISGVTWNKTNKNWRVRISVDGKEKNLGSYSSITEAERAVKKGKEKHWNN